MEHNIVSSLKPELQYGTCYLEIALLESVVARCWVLKDRETDLQDRFWFELALSRRTGPYKLVNQQLLLPGLTSGMVPTVL